MTEPRSHPISQTSPPSGSDHPPAASLQTASADWQFGRADLPEPAATDPSQTSLEIAVVAPSALVPAAVTPTAVVPILVSNLARRVTRVAVLSVGGPFGAQADGQQRGQQGRPAQWIRRLVSSGWVV
jgi:hypothetical protein